MKNNKYLTIGLGFLILLSILALAGCGILSGMNALRPDKQTDDGSEDQLPAVFGPEAAREAALEFVRMSYGDLAPPNGITWTGGEVSTQGLVGSSRFHYTGAGWEIGISFPVVAPEAALYTVNVESGDSAFSWQGLVDADGQVATLSISLEQPTEIPSPTPEDTPVPTQPPTATPEPTPTPLPPTPTPLLLPCNAVKFVADVTIKDGSALAPGTEFVKIWRLENSGTCTWSADYDLVFVSGNRMEARKALSLPAWVRPGERVDLSVAMVAPQSAGDYQGFWMLRSGDGEVFGLGPRTDKAFWVSISVVEPPEDYAYDFAFNYCSATWRSDEGRLSCSEAGDPADGFVRLLPEPELESRQEDELALWVHPNDVRYGWIEGTYPGFRLVDGDRFQAWVGCLDGYSKCSLKFYLDYEDESGRVRRLGEWVEEYDGSITPIDIDLSGYAGETFRFILGTEALTHNTDAAQGFWFVPRIE